MADKSKTAKTTKSKAPNTAKVKAAKPATRKTGAKSTKTPAAETYYVSLPKLALQIQSTKPTDGAKLHQVASFAEAKNKAVDHLIDLIDECERLLHTTRRAGSYEEYRRSAGK